MITPTQKYITTNAIKYTHRTRSGHLARILCMDFEWPEKPTVAAILDGEHERLASLSRDLRVRPGSEHPDDLFERSKWDDVAVDTPIWVRDRGDFPWEPMHFANYENGQVYAWRAGETSHTTGSEPPVAWVYATLKNPNKPTFKPGV